MSNLSEYRGLCSTCKNAPTCIFPRDPERPVLQCEEFDYAIAPVITAGKDFSPANDSWVRSSAEEKGFSKYMGLCSNCENRRTCIYPKPEDGVWRCEQYQ